MLTNIKSAKHYSWGDGCDGWYLLESPEMTIIQERMPPGAAEKCIATPGRGSFSTFFPAPQQ